MAENNQTTRNNTTNFNNYHDNNTRFNASYTPTKNETSNTQQRIQQPAITTYPNIYCPNVSFYENKLRPAPNDVFIDDILNKWCGNFELLENNHFYIQWLFPNIEEGKNEHSYPLSPEEAKIIREREDLKEKVKMAFEMMLDFYGMRLVGSNQFEITQKADKLLTALNTEYNHNHQRITRILKALLELGYDNLMLPWLKFLADLIYKEKKLSFAHFSFEKYWVDTLDAENKLELISYVDELPKLTDITTHGKPSDTTENITSPTTTTNTKAPTEEMEPYSRPEDVKFTDAGSTATTFNPDVSNTSSQLKMGKTAQGDTTKISSMHTNERRHATEATSPSERTYATVAAPPKANNNRSAVIAFYKNEIPSGPRGFYIETILRDWLGNYQQLCDFFNYIPWLFPNRNPGQNHDAPLLTDEDVEQICNSPTLKMRVLKAFRIMLDFFGMKLLEDSQTFALTHNYFERFRTVISPTTFMVITRILYFLIEVNEEQLMVEWLKFFAKLIKEKKIDSCVKYSFNEYWINTLSDQDKEKIKNYIKSINK